MLGDKTSSPSKHHRATIQRATRSERTRCVRAITASWAVSPARLGWQAETVGHSVAQHCAPGFSNFSFLFIIPKIRINFKNPWKIQ
jgi:hypothetical protein